MRKILLSLFVLSGLQSFAEIKTVIGNTGQGWGTASNWLPSGVPVDGDEVIIPPGRTISVKGSFYAGIANLNIFILGVLDFDPSGKLDLGAASQIHLTSSTSSITSNGTSSELIVINSITKYSGSLDGTIFGPKYAVNSSGASPAGFTVGVLPVKISGFTARETNRQVITEWTATEETNLKEYVMERSANGLTWTPLAAISAKGSGSTYQYKDISPRSGRNHYRLKSVDMDGQFQYSSVVTADLKTVSSFKISPNPAHGFLVLNMEKTESQSGKIEIMDANGKTVKQLQVSMGINSVRIPVNDLPAGFYTIQLSHSTGVLGIQNIIIR